MGGYIPREVIDMGEVGYRTGVRAVVCRGACRRGVCVSCSVFGSGNERCVCGWPHTQGGD